MNPPPEKATADAQARPDRSEATGAAFDFAAVVDRYQTPLLRYVRQLVGPHHDAAEELVQETFLRLHRQAVQQGADSVQNLSGWLFRVAHNLAISALRKAGQADKLAGPDVQQAIAERVDNGERSDMLDDLIHREMCDRAVAELNNLPRQQKQVLLLKVIQGFTLREIGEITGLSISNVAYRLSQGLRELASRLREAGLI